MRMKHHVSDDPWRTGTVAWNMLNCVDRLLGFRRTLDGVHLQPMLPSKWKRAGYVRPFRGTDFDISIRRGKKAGITVDGKPIDSDFIAVPMGGLGKAVKVVCTIK